MRVRCRRKESSRSLSHLLMRLLYVYGWASPVSLCVLTVWASIRGPAFIRSFTVDLNNLFKKKLFLGLSCRPSGFIIITSTSLLSVSLSVTFTLGPGSFQPAVVLQNGSLVIDLNRPTLFLLYPETTATTITTWSYLLLWFWHVGLMPFKLVIH